LFFNTLKRIVEKLINYDRLLTKVFIVVLLGWIIVRKMEHIMNKVSRKYVALAILFLLMSITACGSPPAVEDTPVPEPVEIKESPTITPSEEER